MKIGKFTVTHTDDCWILTEESERLDENGNKLIGEDGNVKQASKKSYHATLRQAVNWIIDRKCRECNDLQELVSMLDRAANFTEQFIAATMAEDFHRQTRSD